MFKNVKMLSRVWKRRHFKKNYLVKEIRNGELRKNILIIPEYFKLYLGNCNNSNKIVNEG